VHAFLPRLKKENIFQGRSSGNELLCVLQGKPAIVVHPDVAKALRERRAVVALESTIISHGMPYPQNLQTASEVEDIVWQGTFLFMRSCRHRLCVLEIATAIRGNRRRHRRWRTSCAKVCHFAPAIIIVKHNFTLPCQAAESAETADGAGGGGFHAARRLSLCSRKLDTQLCSNSPLHMPCRATCRRLRR